MNGTCQEVGVNGVVERAEGQEGRDARGRFAKGNRGGPGNPYARRTAELMQAFRDEVSAEDVRAIVRALKERAREGDVAAARLVLQYTIGKPREAVDPDRLDQHEWETVQGQVQPEDALRAVEGVPVRFLSELAGPIMDVQELIARERLQMDAEKERRRQERREARGKKKGRVWQKMEAWIAEWRGEAPSPNGSLPEPRTEHGPDTEKEKRGLA